MTKTKERDKLDREADQEYESAARNMRDSGRNVSLQGIQLFPKSKSYYDNYDKIDWSK
jgi:hypothetical protein